MNDKEEAIRLFKEARKVKPSRADKVARTAGAKEMLAAVAAAATEAKYAEVSEGKAWALERLKTPIDDRSKRFAHDPEWVLKDPEKKGEVLLYLGEGKIGVDTAEHHGPRIPFADPLVEYDANEGRWIGTAAPGGERSAVKAVVERVVQALASLAGP
jgi:hypothetical protein